MTTDEILDEVLDREGGFRAQVVRPDGSIDPDTMYGVTAPVLGNWLGLSRPATVAELKAMTPQTAKDIFRVRYIEQPGFTPENIPFEPLRIQVIDFGVNSGQERAVRWLQRILRVPATGTLDETTKRSIWSACGYATGGSAFNGDQIAHIVNDALVAARSYMIDRAVDTGTMRKQDEEGVESRALSFFLAKP